LVIAGTILAARINHPAIYRQHDNQAPYEYSTRKQEAHPGETFWQRTLSDPNAFFALCVSIFTAVLAFSTIGLWIATVRLWRSSETHAGHMGTSVAEASRAATAMERSANIAEDARQNIERPYLFVAELTAKYVFGNDGTANPPDKDCATLHFSFKIFNHGRTPAIVSEIIFGMQYGFGPDSPRVIPVLRIGDIDRSLGLGHRIYAVIPPGEHIVPRTQVYSGPKIQGIANEEDLYHFRP
jgi:hypothetical protein